MGTIRLIRESNCGASEKEMLEALKHIHEDVQYFREHREEWLADYPNEWVAVRDRALVGHHSKRQELIARLRTAGIDPAYSIIEYMTRDRQLQVL